jgi:lysozyme
MNLTSRAALRQDVMAAEGFRQFPYFDCCGKPFRQCVCARQGKLTIAYGRNLEDVGIDKLEAEVLLDHDLYKSEHNAGKAFEWFKDLTDLRQRAITELVFNMGLAKFREFRQTIRAIEVGQFVAASFHLLASKWKTQVGPTRSNRIARYLRDAE